MRLALGIGQLIAMLVVVAAILAIAITYDDHRPQRALVGGMSAAVLLAVASAVLG